MRLTRHTNYSIRILMYCCVKDELTTIGEIARFYSLPENFLTKILYTLSKSGFVNTVRGRGGGIQLAMPAAQMRLGDIIRRTEENFALAECFQEGEIQCPLVMACGLNQALSLALTAFFDTLNQYTLEDLTQKRFAIGRLDELSVPEEAASKT